jgi:hypothetical protein
VAIRFGKIIFFIILTKSLFAGMCCCTPQIKATTSSILRFIKIQNLDVANLRLQNALKMQSDILKIMQSNNAMIQMIANIEYNNKVSNGILLKLKALNDQEDKLIKMMIY